MKINMAIDSGAYSLAGKHVFGKGRTGPPKFDFYATQKFTDYFDRYIAWIKQFGDTVDYYITLDVIGNAEMSWDVYRQMRKAGVNPMPCVHGGEDLKWVKKYFDETDYISVGGYIGPNLGVRQARMAEYRTWLSQVFKIAGPKRRIHGLAATDFSLLRDYPWYSVDSARCWWVSSMGQLLLPQPVFEKKGIRFTYLTRPYPFVFTNRSDRKAGKGQHINRGGDVHQEVFEAYLKQFGYTLEQVGAEGKDGYLARSVVNADFFCSLERELCETRGTPFKLYISGFVPGGWGPDVLFQEFAKAGRVDQFSFLGTFFDLKQFNLFEQESKKHENKTAAPRAKIGKRRAP
jgi:hypothetical protein